MPADVKHVFVLMLENRSFDHIFGFSGLTGTDAATGAHTVVDGLTGDESNVFDGTPYRVSRGADYVMPTDPGHEFLNVLDQLCGPSARYLPGGAYPEINRSGYVDSYCHSGGGSNPGEVMKCFDTARQLPVVSALAQEFALCDRWFSSIPGPTWPNRMFAHAGSSGGLDHSPTNAEIVEWETVDGFEFANGSLFDRLKERQLPYHFYAGDDFPVVAALKGIDLLDIQDIEQLQTDLQQKSFPYAYVFIEPSYNVLYDFRNSSSQHPLADMRDGEALIKQVYESLRASPSWENSLLIVTWDEHGGFFDHVSPRGATIPGDTAVGSKYNQYGFTFAQYGPRVPALVISPWIPRNTIDHRIYDHSSIPATLRGVFPLGPLTARDAAANTVLSLLSLPAARTDAPMTVPAPLSPPALATAAVPGAHATIGTDTTPVSRPHDSVNDGKLPTILHSALRQELLLSSPEDRPAILAKVAAIRTRQDAMNYLQSVQTKVRAARSVPSARPSTKGPTAKPSARSRTRGTSKKTRARARRRKR